MFAGAEADAHEGAAAVAYHDGQCERHDGQRKDHRVGRVAVGAQIAGVGDKNLIHDVVQRAHQQGNDTGQGIAAHQASHGLYAQGLTGLRELGRSGNYLVFFHKMYLPSFIKKAHGLRRWIYAVGHTLLGELFNFRPPLPASR